MTGPMSKKEEIKADIEQRVQFSKSEFEAAIQKAKDKTSKSAPIKQKDVYMGDGGDSDD